MRQTTVPAVNIRKDLDIRIVLAFGALYLVWGSVFLAIRLAIESFPPLLLIGLRCLGAGTLLYLWVAFKTREKLHWRQWRNAAIGGFCLFVVSQGYVAWSEQFVPSGIVAVMMALLPLWVVLLEWWRPGGKKPGGMVLLGIVVGFSGMVLLVGPGILSNGASADTLVTLFLPVAALAWAIGTMYTRYQAHGPFISRNVLAATFDGRHYAAGNKWCNRRLG